MLRRPGATSPLKVATLTRSCSRRAPSLLTTVMQFPERTTLREVPPELRTAKAKLRRPTVILRTLNRVPVNPVVPPCEPGARSTPAPAATVPDGQLRAAERRVPGEITSDQG